MCNFITCSTHLPEKADGIYAVLLRNSVTVAGANVTESKSFLAFAKYLGKGRWQTYDEIEQEITKLDDYIEENIIPAEYEGALVVQEEGKSIAYDGICREDVIAYCPLGTAESIRKICA